MASRMIGSGKFSSRTNRGRLRGSDVEVLLELILQVDRLSDVGHVEGRVHLDNLILAEATAGQGCQHPSRDSRGLDMRLAR